MAEPTRLLWLDLETTGLDRHHDHILEIGCVMTNRVLEKKGQFARVIRHDPLPPMPDVVVRMHEKSGLLELLTADHAEPLAVAEQSLLDWMERMGCEDGRTMLAGTGVSHFDQFFIERLMPEVWKKLHYGLIDVGVLRRFTELTVGREVAGSLTAQPEIGHRALDDARAALASAHRWAARISSGRH